MLASPDAELATRYTSLPGLPIVLDVEALRGAASFSGMNLPEGLEAGYVRFKPSTSCLVGYRAAGTNDPPAFYATAFRAGSDKLKKARVRPEWPTTAGRGRVVLDDVSVEVCAFPNDDHLKSLGELFDARIGARMIKWLVRERVEVPEPGFRAFTYKPERRCVLQVSSAGTPAALIKAYTGRAFGDSVRKAKVVAEQSDVRVPRVIGTNFRRSLVSLEWLEGRVLQEMLSEREADFGCVFETGVHLSRFHARPLRDLAPLPISLVVRRLSDIVSTIGALRPELRRPARRVLHQLDGELSREADGVVTVHGDFYAKQVLVSGGTIVFLDTDECGVGAPAMDIGNFIAHLELGALRGDFPSTAVAIGRQALIDGYGSSGGNANERSIRLWTAAGLMLVTHEPFRHHRPQWPEQVASLLDRVEEVLAE